MINDRRDQLINVRFKGSRLLAGRKVADCNRHANLLNKSEHFFGFSTPFRLKNLSFRLKNLFSFHLTHGSFLSDILQTGRVDQDVC